MLIPMIPQLFDSGRDLMHTCILLGGIALNYFYSLFLSPVVTGLVYNWTLIILNILLIVLTIHKILEYRLKIKELKEKTEDEDEPL